jgi:hypothetical protein
MFRFKDDKPLNNLYFKIRKDNEFRNFQKKKQKMSIMGGDRN